MHAAMARRSASARLAMRPALTAVDGRQLDSHCHAQAHLEASQLPASCPFATRAEGAESSAKGLFGRGGCR